MFPIVLLLGKDRIKVGVWEPNPSKMEKAEGPGATQPEGVCGAKEN